MSVKDHPISRQRQTTPSATTPRQQHAMYPHPPQGEDGSNMKTPTRDTFTGLTGQRPLPSPKGFSARDKTPQPGMPAAEPRPDHTRHFSDPADTEMGEVDENDLSDSESTTGDAKSKKKKSQKFFCTEFPGCNLSFTRSEHLARHIRKHTGERPFQCHCLRRFSRLDNLRQHAQTVHLNEDIPGDSLAATSTRFQRQIRTDRMRPPNTRARGSSQSSHSRGHSRNWSESSIGSVSDIASPDEFRRRPPPLAMAQMPPSRGNLTVDTYGAADTYPSYFHDSPSGYSTPTSVFSATESSPIVPSGYHSPINMLTRSATWGDRHLARRLSVPSSQNPFHPHYAPTGAQYMAPPAPPSISTTSNSGSGFASPTSSVFSDVRREPLSGEPDIRRRTWHPGTYGVYGSRPPTSGLSYYQTPDAPQPVAAPQPAAAQAIRLPGIEAFDSARAQPIAPLRRPPSPMDESTPRRQKTSNTVVTARQPGTQNANRDSWGSISSQMTRLEVAQPSETAAAWREETIKQLQPHISPVAAPPHASMHAPHKSAPANISVRFAEPNRAPAADLASERRKKRQAWYNGPLQNAPEPAASYVAVGTSPEGSNTSSEGVPTPAGMPGPAYHPAIVHSNGYVEAQPPGLMLDEAQKAHPNVMPRSGYAPPHYHAQQPPQIPPIRAGGEMNRLDALAAIATGENPSLHRR